jgi:hypothetical protein
MRYVPDTFRLGNQRIEEGKLYAQPKKQRSGMEKYQRKRLLKLQRKQ